MDMKINSYLNSSNISGLNNKIAQTQKQNALVKLIMLFVIYLVQFIY